MAAVREFEGESLDAALEAASAELGIPVDDLQYEMVEQGRKGVLGFGARQVRVRIELDRSELLAPTAVPRKRDPRPRQRNDRGRSRDNRGGRGGGRGKRGNRSERAARPARAERTVHPGEEPERTDVPHQKEFQETLERMLELIGLEMSVKVSGSGSNNIRAVLSGRDRRMLLQKEGQLISSINFVLNRMARRAFGDAGHERGRNKESL